APGRSQAGPRPPGGPADVLVGRGAVMNAFRQLLKASGAHPPVGTWIGSANPVVAEAIGCAGFDWGLVDMEHAPLDIAGLVHMLQAAATSRMVAVVRVPCNDAVTGQRVVAAGAGTPIVPF